MIKSKILITKFVVISILLLLDFLLLVGGVHAQDETSSFNLIPSATDRYLQRGLDKVIVKLGLQKAAKEGRLGLVVLDITDLKHTRFAAINPDKMMYAASLPKIAILFGLFKRIEEHSMLWNAQTMALASPMIAESSNIAATALYHAVGPQYIEKLLTSPKFGLYDAAKGGGLWIGKEYGKSPAWKRDPVANLSHAASAVKVAQFYYLLETGQLVSPVLKPIMESVLKKTQLHTKFVKGLKNKYPDAVLYRKSGTWGDFQSDGAVVEHAGKKYIAVGLTQDKDGSIWLEKLIVEIDRLIHEPVRCGRLQGCYK